MVEQNPDLEARKGEEDLDARGLSLCEGTFALRVESVSIKDAKDLIEVLGAFACLVEDARRRASRRWFHRQEPGWIGPTFTLVELDADLLEVEEFALLALHDQPERLPRGLAGRRPPQPSPGAMGDR